MKILRVVVPLLLIFILGISCFASPGYDRGSSYNTNITPDSGYIEIQSIDYLGYAVNRFVLGGYSTESMYSMDGISVSTPITDGIVRTMKYTFNHSLGGIRISFPISFVRIDDTSGGIIPNSFANITFNKDVYLFRTFTVLEPDGNLGLIAQEKYIPANTPIDWVEGVPYGVNILLDYVCTVTFPSTPESGVEMIYSDSYSDSFSNTLENLVQLNNFDSGYKQGVLDGEVIGRDKGYQEGYNAGLEADTFSGFGTFMTTVLGGFLNAPFLGGITVGGILLAFVGFAVALWLLKLLAGG